MKLLSPHVYIGFFIALLSAAVAVAYSEGGMIDMLISLLVWVPVFGLSLFAGAVQAQKEEAPSEKIVNIVAVLAMFALAYGYMENGLSYGLLLFVLWIQVARNVALIKDRDLYFGLTVSMAALVFAASNSLKGGFASFIVCYAFGCIYSLTALYQNNRIQSANMKIDNHRFSLGLAVPLFASFTLVLALALYFSIPRPTATHLGAFPAKGGSDLTDKRWEDEASNSDGDAPEQSDESNGNEGNASASKSSDDEKLEEFSESYPVGMQGSGTLSNELLFYMQAPNGLYLRGTTFDQFNERGWVQSKKGLETLKLKFGRLEVGPSNTSNLTQHTIHLQNEFSATLFSPGDVKEIMLPGSVVARDPYGNYLAPKLLPADTTYSIRSEVNEYNGRPVSASQKDINTTRYLQLPKSFPESIKNYAETLTADVENDYDKAVALEQHLRSDFEYTFDSVFDQQNVGNLETFLFDTKKGHCSYFATALTTMLRSLDIPSRVATGFSATTYNPMSGYYEVRGLDAHAWVEVLQPGVGWVIFEPTAYYNMPEPQHSNSVGQSVEDYLEQLNQHSLASTDLKPASLKQKLTAVAYRVFKNIRRFVDTVLAVSWRVITSYFWDALALLAILLGALTLRIWFTVPIEKTMIRIRSLAIKGKNNTKQAEFCYSSMESLFSKAKQPRLLGETITEYKTRMICIYPELKESIAAVCEAQNNVLFSGAAEPTKEVSLMTNDALIKLLMHRYPTHERSFAVLKGYFGLAKFTAP